MKKIVALFSALIMLASLMSGFTACGEEAAETTATVSAVTESKATEPQTTKTTVSATTVITAATTTVATTVSTAESTEQQTTAATETTQAEEPVAELKKAAALDMTAVENHTFVRLWQDCERDPYYSTAYDNYYANSHATIAAYIVKNSPSCVIIFPGGGYNTTTEPTEGTSIAEAYNKQGISAFVVHYRCFPSSTREATLMDAQRAVQYVRFYADDFGIDSEKIAVCGFSAGGHLSMLLCEHTISENPLNDEIGAVSDRPNACILSYPVLVLDDGNSSTTAIFLNKDRKNQELVDFYSCNYNIKGMPATFLWYSLKDTSVKKEKNADVFVAAMKEANMTLEVHEFNDGKHGIGLATGYLEAGTWLTLSIRFLHEVAGF